MAKVKHETIMSVSINGQQFDADKKGQFDVPDELVGELNATFGGFVPVTTTKKASASEQPDTQAE